MDTVDTLHFPEALCQDALTALLRQGAQRMLLCAIEAEIKDYIAAHQHVRDGNNHRLVVRNGYKDKRELQTGIAVPFTPTRRRPSLHQ